MVSTALHCRAALQCRLHYSAVQCSEVEPAEGMDAVCLCGVLGNYGHEPAAAGREQQEREGGSRREQQEREGGSRREQEEREVGSRE